ncbi:hypothetical protein [Chryseobacterium indoltheticum]|uniref:Uncharacterized protein n=1 Tax=Chryseobacterium indoltheticum TaxID=254 RepID=A0A381FQP3_9FLAO|nr:hypothetical protein [Chryseobacterium indoltheticum]SUX48773.1 Uncharacterised protein [Chryseobacterium indoltheticum]
MSKQFIVFIVNILKLIGITYISIGLKNILQILFGTVFNAEFDAKSYKLINLGMRSTFETKLGLIEVMLIYDLVIFMLTVYIWFFLLLYFFVQISGNKVWFHIVYMVIIYLTVTLVFDNFKPNFLFILITVILGTANWWMFKKWIKLNPAHD